MVPGTLSPVQSSAAYRSAARDGGAASSLAQQARAQRRIRAQGEAGRLTAGVCDHRVDEPDPGARRTATSAEKPRQDVAPKKMPPSAMANDPPGCTRRRRGCAPHPARPRRAPTTRRARPRSARADDPIVAAGAGARSSRDRKTTPARSIRSIPAISVRRLRICYGGPETQRDRGVSQQRERRAKPTRASESPTATR